MPLWYPIKHRNDLQIPSFVINEIILAYRMCKSPKDLNHLNTEPESGENGGKDKCLGSIWTKIIFVIYYDDYPIKRRNDLQLWNFVINDIILAYRMYNLCKDLNDLNIEPENGENGGKANSWGPYE